MKQASSRAKTSLSTIAGLTVIFTRNEPKQRALEQS
jgi:hypothetical protein